MIIFGDTSGWAAFFNRRDQTHARALAALRDSVGQPVTFAITDYVFDETLTLLRGRASHAAAVRCGKWLIESPLVRLIRVTEAHWRSAWEIFQQYDDKEYSFTDCVSFVVMREHRLREVFAFDHHFMQMGFRLWPDGES
jgi:predicted nucleic acid-binding protein